MKKKLMFAPSAVLLLCATWTQSAMAATEAQKLAAIQGGLAHLAYIQCGTAGTTKGSIGQGNTSGTTCSSSNADAFTGMSVVAFLARTADWPAANTYTTTVANAMTYLLTTASTSSVSTNNDGVNICPSGSGSCTAIYWTTCTYSTYCTGFVSQAISEYGKLQGAGTIGDNNPVGAGHPLGGMTYGQIAQGITNAYAAGQAGAVNSGNNGGWRYYVPSNTGSDMSTTQWGAIAAGYGEALGAVTPSYLKAHLKTYLPTVLGCTNGGACYVAGSSFSPSFGENGGWMVSNSYAGNAPAAAILTFMNAQWKTAGNSYSGNFGQPYGMWATYKGLGAVYGITNTTAIQSASLLTDCGVAKGQGPQASSLSGGVCNWWEDYNEWLVNGTASYPAAIPNTQITTDGANGGGVNGNKYWIGESDWVDPLSTAVNVAILAAIPLPQSISNPNPTPTVPTLSMVGLVVLGIMLAGFAALKLRKQRTA